MFGNLGGDSAESIWAKGCLRLRQILPQWYKAKRKMLVEGENLYEICDLKPSMLGLPRRPYLAIKAAETATFLEFVRDLLRTHQAKLENGAALFALADTLVSHRDQMRYGPRFVRLHSRRNFMILLPGPSICAKRQVLDSCRNGTCFYILQQIQRSTEIQNTGAHFWMKATTVKLQRSLQGCTDLPGMFVC